MVESFARWISIESCESKSLEPSGLKLGAILAEPNDGIRKTLNIIFRRSSMRAEKETFSSQKAFSRVVFHFTLISIKNHLKTLKMSHFSSSVFTVKPIEDDFVSRQTK